MKPKILDILKAGAGIAGVLAGAKVKSVTDIIDATILNDDDPLNEQGLRDLAEINDDQNKVLVNHEERLRRLEEKLR